MPDTGPRHGSFCTGYGGLDIATQAVYGGQLAWTSDIDPGAARIINHRMPGIPNLGNLTTTNWQAVLDEHGPVDIVTAGFPCQDVSLAGKRAGIGKGTRTGIWAHITDAIGVLRPSTVVLENVRGLLSPLPMEEPNDRCVCGWPRRWRGLHHDPVSEQDVLDSRGHRDDDASPVRTGLDAVDLRRDGVPQPTGDGSVGGGDLLDGDGTDGSSLPGADLTPSSNQGGPGGSGPESGRNSDLAGAVRSGTPLDRRGPRALLDPSPAGTGAESQGPDRPAVLGELDAGCPACGRPVGDRSGGPVLRSGLDVVLRDLARLGFDAQWCTVRASEVGAPHRRERLFLLAVAADAAHLGHERGWDARRRGHGPADHGHAPAYPQGLGRGEGRPEPARLQGGPDTSLGSAPDWGAYAPAIARWETVTGRRAPWATDDRRRLSPAFVEWLMGLPAGWVTHVPDLTRTQQLKALGNGVVPQQAEAAIRLLHDRAPA